MLSIVNFRYVPENASSSDEELDRLNRRIVNRLVGNGSFLLAPTILKGKTAMRACIVNFRTTEDDIRALPEIVKRVGAELVPAAR
jgi:aromatic-L-amino-acid/L-tryptophan decarboxylase